MHEDRATVDGIPMRWLERGEGPWPIPSVRFMRAIGRVLRHVPSPMLASSLRVFLARGHDDATAAAEAAEIHLPRYARDGGAEAFVRQVQSLDVRDTLAVQDRLSGLEIPASVVWGEADQFQKMRYGERFARDLGAELTRIPGGKHYTPEDHPEEVAAGITAVMERSSF